MKWTFNNDRHVFEVAFSRHLPFIEGVETPWFVICAEWEKRDYGPFTIVKSKGDNSTTYLLWHPLYVTFSNLIAWRRQQKARQAATT